MKRILLILWVAMISFVGTAPAILGVPVTASQTAMAVQVQGGGSGNTGCVKLSIKINKGDSNQVCANGEPGGVIIVYLKLILKFLSAGVGIVILLMMIIAGVQYITAAGQPEGVRAAKNRITNAITALVLFLIAFAVLNLIIPGGIFA